MRSRGLMLLVVGALVGGVIGFGLGHWVVKPGETTPTTTTSIATTTTTAPPSVTVTPESGPIGTSFALQGRQFHPGSSVHFEITFPNGRIFSGQPHAVAADGTVATTYAATAGNPAGIYTVKGVDDQGATATATFGVGVPAPTTTSTTSRPVSTATTRR